MWKLGILASLLRRLRRVHNVIDTISYADESVRLGRFYVAPDRAIHGELTLDADKTSLYLHDTEPFRVNNSTTLTGVLHDLTKVSLIDCVTPGESSGSRGQERY